MSWQGEQGFEDEIVLVYFGGKRVGCALGVWIRRRCSLHGGAIWRDLRDAAMHGVVMGVRGGEEMWTQGNYRVCV